MLRTWILTLCLPVLLLLLPGCPSKTVEPACQLQIDQCLSECPDPDDPSGFAGGGEGLLGIGSSHKKCQRECKHVCDDDADSPDDSAPDDDPGIAP